MALIPIAVAVVATQAAQQVQVLENFESTSSNEEIAKAWYRPLHGNFARSSVAKSGKSNRRQALRGDFMTGPEEGKGYAAVSRVHRWPVSPSDNALRFWLKPDGSGQPVNAEINLAGVDHDLWGYTTQLKKGDKSGRWITIPFAKLVRPKWLEGQGRDPVFRLHDIVEIAFYFGGEKGLFGKASYVIGDISVLHTD